MKLLAATALLLVATPALADDELKGHKGDVNAVAVSPDGKLFASGGDDNNTLIWDGGKSTTHASDQGRVKALAFSPDGKYLAIGTDIGNVQVWDFATKKDLFSSRSLEGHVTAIQFMPDSKTFVVAGGHTLVILDTTTGKEKVKLAAHKYDVRGLALAKDGKTIFSCDTNGDVITWKANKASKPQSVDKAECHALALSPDGKQLAAGFGDNNVIVIDPASGKEQRRAKVADSVNALAFTTDGKMIAVGTQNEELQLIDNTNTVTTKKGHQRPITSVAVTTDGRIVTTSMDQTVHVFAK